MTGLLDSLDQLSPLAWADVPADDLESFAKNLLRAGELLCNSVPPADGGEGFETSSISHPQPNSAASADELVISTARAPLPAPSLVALRKSWGKPINISLEENTVGLTIYKMAGHDRHGAWFARHSVHEGVSFARVKKAMQNEHATSLSVQKGPGSGAVRGLGTDQKLEDCSIEGVGRLVVYQLSAQFGGPTTPREFVEMLLMSDRPVTEATSALPEGQSPAQHFMIVSRPVSHPDAPPRSDYIRAAYESVEMIREIPLEVESDKRPVEWIQISRSDPGGSIPRFMVERGTPSAVCRDARKFLEWACASTATLDEVASTDKSVPKPGDNAIQPSPPAFGAVQGQSQSCVKDRPLSTRSDKSNPAAAPNQSDLAFHLTDALKAGQTQYAPAVVADYARSLKDDGRSRAEAEHVESSSSSSTSVAEASSSYESADDHFAAEDTAVQSRALLALSPESRSSESVNKHDKAAQKLQDKLAKKHQELNKKLEAAPHKDLSEQQKSKQKHDKELRKTRAKHDKEVQRLQAKRDKELEKARHKRDKQARQDLLSRVVRERDEFRDRVAQLLHENESLKARLRDYDGQAERGQSGGVAVPAR